MERTSGGHLVQHPCSNISTSCRFPCSVSRCVLNISKECNSTSSMGHLCQCFVTLTLCFLVFRRGLLSFLLCPLPPWSFCSPRRAVPSQPLLTGEGLQSLHHLCDPLLVSSLDPSTPGWCLLLQSFSTTSLGLISMSSHAALLPCYISHVLDPKHLVCYDLSGTLDW